MPAPTYPINRIGQYELVTIPVSFETNELWSTAVKLPALPYRFKVISAKTVVTKAIAASNDATVTVKKSSTTIATVTLAASSAIGDEDTASSVGETVVATTEQLSIETAKSSAGGKGLLYLLLEVLPSYS